MTLRPALVPALLLAPVLTACSGDAELASDASDLDVAVGVWSDPWVAPTSARVAGPELGSDGMLDRVVARRETSYATPVRQAARAELRLARATGWDTTSSSCADTVQVSLTSPDQDAVAQLVVAPALRGSEVALEVAVRHHLDSSWRVPDAGTTCLDGDTAPPFVTPPLSGKVLGDATEDRDAEWEQGDPAEDFIDAVDADPAMQDLGITVAVPRIDDGVNRRQAPAAEADVPVGSLQELVAVLPGWRLTSAACGAGGPVRATFVQDVADGHAVLSADVRPDGTTVRVTLPMTEGPTGEWLDGTEVVAPTACLAADPPRRLEAYGTPAVLPTVLTPIAD